MAAKRAGTVVAVQIALTNQDFEGQAGRSSAA